MKKRKRKDEKLNRIEIFEKVKSGATNPFKACLLLITCVFRSTMMTVICLNGLSSIVAMGIMCVFQGAFSKDRWPVFL